MRPEERRKIIEWYMPELKGEHWIQSFDDEHIFIDQDITIPSPQFTYQAVFEDYIPRLMEEGADVMMDAIHNLRTGTRMFWDIVFWDIVVTDPEDWDNAQIFSGSTFTECLLQYINAKESELDH